MLEFNWQQVQADRAITAMQEGMKVAGIDPREVQISVHYSSVLYETIIDIKYHGRYLPPIRVPGDVWGRKEQADLFLVGNVIWW